MTYLRSLHLPPLPSCCCSSSSQEIYPFGLWHKRNKKNTWKKPSPFPSQITTVKTQTGFHEILDTEVEIERHMILCELGRKKRCLSELSSWGIGGPCGHFLEVTCPNQLISAVRCCQRLSMPFIIVGKGSNCLFDDRGFDGCVILNRIESIERVGDGVYRVGSGYTFNRLGVHCSSEGYSGLEFAGGIPGTVGGAAFMNAGANGQETADAIDSAEIVTTNGDVQLLTRRDLVFGYRQSIFQGMEELAAILAVTFKLCTSVSARRRQQDYLQRRRRTQPIGERCAGSVFRNPLCSGMSAGELIEKAGLKAFKLGGAKVSEVHANFFINFDNSTSKDMLGLIKFVKETVHRKLGVELEEEIRYVPYNVV